MLFFKFLSDNSKSMAISGSATIQYFFLWNIDCIHWLIWMFYDILQKNALSLIYTVQPSSCVVAVGSFLLFQFVLSFLYLKTLFLCVCFSPRSEDGGLALCDAREGVSCFSCSTPSLAQGKASNVTDLLQPSGLLPSQPLVPESSRCFVWIYLNFLTSPQFLAQCVQALDENPWERIKKSG